MDKDSLDVFKKQLTEYSEEEIKSILKKRNHYDPEAAKHTIIEAISRGLINSEDDLMDEEFRIKPLQLSIFPGIEKIETRQRVLKSLMRAILLFGLIPTIFGLIRYTENNLPESFIFLTVGGIWIATSGFLLRRQEVKFVYIILSLALLSAFYIAQLLYKTNGIGLMDVFIVIIIYFVIFYSLLYVKSLIVSGDVGN